MRFVQSDEDIKWMRGVAHFECPRCGKKIEIVERLS
jgi:predicted RNA-binding Zn-ribbon protein involved in translation (DUF1610 family)